MTIIPHLNYALSSTPVFSSGLYYSKGRRFLLLFRSCTGRSGRARFTVQVLGSLTREVGSAGHSGRARLLVQVLGSLSRHSIAKVQF